MRVGGLAHSGQRRVVAKGRRRVQAPGRHANVFRVHPRRAGARRKRGSVSAPIGRSGSSLGSPQQGLRSKRQFSSISFPLAVDRPNHGLHGHHPRRGALARQRPPGEEAECQTHQRVLLGAEPFAQHLAIGRHMRFHPQFDHFPSKRAMAGITQHARRHAGVALVPSIERAETAAPPRPGGYFSGNRKVHWARSCQLAPPLSGVITLE